MAQQQNTMLMKKLQSLLYQVNTKRMKIKQKRLKDFPSLKNHDQNREEKRAEREYQSCKKEIPRNKISKAKPKSRRRQRRLHKRRKNSPVPTFSPRPPDDLSKRRHRRQRRRELRGRLPIIRRFCSIDVPVDVVCDKTICTGIQCQNV